MIYPEFLKNDDTIGITALSAGVGEKIESFNKSINSIQKHGFKIIETPNVRTENFISSSPEIRAKELDELITDDNIKMVMCAAGGDYQIETLPYINYENIKNNPKWIMGYSDPTNLLYIVTTKLDIATIYGKNAGSFDQTILHRSLEDTFSIIKGNIIDQKSFELYEKVQLENIDGYNLTEKVYWENLNCDTFNQEGRIIGGCLDIIKSIIGTKYDYTLEFIEKYKNDGIIWYFDIYSMDSEEVFRTLFQMKQMGWFEHTKGILFGRVMYPREFCMSYQDNVQKAVPDIPIIFNCDIGHVSPKMTIINGAYAKIESHDGKGTIKLELN